MLRTFTGLSIFILALLNVGCGDNNIVANSTVKSGTYYAETGITGSSNVVTIEQGSRLSKLSIIGNGNEVEVEDGVRLPMIEIWGSDNTITVPGDMLVQMNEVGHRNQIIRRPLPEVQQTPVFYETNPQTDVTIYQQQEIIDPQGNVTSSRSFETRYTSPNDPADSPETSIQELRRIAPPIEEMQDDPGVNETTYESTTSSEPGVVETDYEPMKSTPDEPINDDEEDLTPLK